MRIPKLPDSLKVARVYLRVSTDEQDLQRQEAITGQAKAAGYYVAASTAKRPAAHVPTGPSCCAWWPTCNRAKWSLPRRSTA